MEHVAEAQVLRRQLLRVSRLVSLAINTARLDGWLPGDPISSVVGTDVELTAAPLSTRLSAFQLSSTEHDVLWLLAGYDLDGRLRRLVDELSGDVGKPTVGAVMAVVYPGRASLGLEELSSEGRLARHALTELDVAGGHLPLSFLEA